MNGCLFLPDGTQIAIPCDAQEVSDGSHRFSDLYDHRCLLFIALMKSHPQMSWRSFRHNDGSAHDGWFVAGMRAPDGDITYHLPESMWGLLNGIEEKKVAPPWDGHTSGRVLEILEKWDVRGNHDTR